MAKLTKYTSFRKLKLSDNSISRTSSNESITMSEFEEFIKVLKKATLKKSALKKTSHVSNEK